MSFFKHIFPTVRSRALVISKPFPVPRNSSTEPISRRFASMYKAAFVKEFNQPLVIEETKRKSLKKDKVRIGVYASLPFITGFEVSNQQIK